MMLFYVNKAVIIHEINDTFKRFSKNELKNSLFYRKEPIVSVQINNSCLSWTFDSKVKFAKHLLQNSKY